MHGRGKGLDAVVDPFLDCRMVSLDQAGEIGLVAGRFAPVTQVPGEGIERSAGQQQLPFPSDRGAEGRRLGGTGITAMSLALPPTPRRQSPSSATPQPITGPRNRWMKSSASRPQP